MIYSFNFKQKIRRDKNFSKIIENKSVVYATWQLDVGRPKGARTVSPVLKSKILDLLQAGKSYAYVSEYYFISKSIIKGIVRRKKYVTEGVQRKPFVIKPKLVPHSVRRLLNYIIENSKLPLFAIAVRFRTVQGSNLSEPTIRRCLHKNGMRS